MKYIKSYLVINESVTYTIEGRPNHVYKPADKYWKYARVGEDTWNLVENDESVGKLNSKYKLDLGIFKPKGFSKYKIIARPGHYYKVDPTNQFWLYYIINATEVKWYGVENETSVKSLNSKYGLNLSAYVPLKGASVGSKGAVAALKASSSYKLLYKGWEERGISAAKYLVKTGVDIGMTKMLASAFVGNFKVESGVRHDVSQISTKGLKLGFGFKPTTLSEAKTQKAWTGYGVAQWTNSRKDALINSNANNITKQLDFVIKELKGSSMWKSIKEAKTLDIAASLVVTKYERAGIKHLKDRQEAASYIYSKL